MKSITCFLFMLFLLSVDLFAQRIMVSDMNKHLPGAVYKFSFVQLTDIHVGEGIADYGSTGYINDTMPQGDIGYSAIRLRKAVNWINAHAKKRNIRFVVVTGDLTDSGEKSEFDKVDEILSSLTVPFVPQIGNHDVISHNNISKASTAFGDSLDMMVFRHEFDTLRHFFDHWNDGFRLTKVYSPYSQAGQYLQNFMFDYQGFGFLFCDFNPRFKDHRPATDHGPKPRLNDFPGGSFDWLKNTLQAYPNKGDHNIFIFTHQPPHHDMMAHFNGLPTDEYDKLTQALLPYRDHLAFWLAGHVHRNKSYPVRTLHSHKFVIKARETAANKHYRNGLLRVINVYEAPERN
jgi:3',5'-cyclic AMP phosphodiesterase CpdA